MIEHCWHCCRLLASPLTGAPKKKRGEGWRRTKTILKEKWNNPVGDLQNGISENHMWPWVCCSMLHGRHRQQRHLDGFSVSNARHSGLRFLTSFEKSNVKSFFYILWYLLIVCIRNCRFSSGRQDKPWEVTPAFDRFSTRWGTEPTPRWPRSDAVWKLMEPEEDNSPCCTDDSDDPKTIESVTLQLNQLS